MSELQERVQRWTADGYRVVSQTPTSAQLVRPKHFNAAEFVAMPLYAIEYFGQREQQVYLAVDDAGGVTETGSGTEVSRYRRAQQVSGPMRLAWVVIVFVAVVGVILVVQAIA